MTCFDMCRSSSGDVYLKKTKEGSTCDAEFLCIVVFGPLFVQCIRGYVSFS
jgi:hypothetical protein